MFSEGYVLEMSIKDYYKNGGASRVMGKSLSELNKESGRYYGYEAQSNQLVEECAELIQAVNKYRRARGKGQNTEDAEQIALENLKEEIVDVEIMLEQIKDLLQLPEDELAAIKIYKVNRTRERMKK